MECRIENQVITTGSQAVTLDKSSGGLLIGWMVSGVVAAYQAFSGNVGFRLK